MTEFCEAVPYAIYCVGLHTSLEPEEALIYLYDGRMVELSLQAAVGSTIDLYGTKLRHPDNTTIIEVLEGLFWLQTSVQASSTDAIES